MLKTAMKAIAIGLLVSGISFYAKAAESGPGLFEFAKAQRERRYEQVPHKVLAFYYTWYGMPERQGEWIHWERVNLDKKDIGSSTHYPVNGPYDSLDPAVIGKHIDQAKQSSLDGFICTWWGQGGITDKAIPILLDTAAKKDFSITVYWETIEKNGAPSLDRGVSDVAYILKKYGKHPGFLKVGGKPVIFVYGRVMAEVKPGQWPEMITRIR